MRLLEDFGFFPQAGRAGALIGKSCALRRCGSAGAERSCGRFRDEGAKTSAFMPPDAILRQWGVRSRRRDLPAKLPDGESGLARRQTATQIAATGMPMQDVATKKAG